MLEVLLSYASATVTLLLCKLSRIRWTKFLVRIHVNVNPCIVLLLMTIEDVYNMQLSNQPAEELAEVLVASSNGAFESCGFVSGGESFVSSYS